MSPLVEATIASLEAKLQEALGANDRLHEVMMKQIARIHELELKLNATAVS